MISYLKKNLDNISPVKLAVGAGLLYALLDIVSFFGWVWSPVSSLVTVILVLLWLGLGIKNLPLAASLLIVELILGSFGYLFNFVFGSWEISLRLGLFLAAFGLMLYRIASNRKHIIFDHPWRWWFVAAMASLAWAAGRGYYFWNTPADIFLDVNGYLYILLLPLFLEAYAEIKQEKIISYTRLVLLPAIIWLTIRTVLLLYVFTHFEAGDITWLYRWYRDVGLGEITPAGGGFFRIFSQSHVFSSLATVLGFVWLRHKLKNSLLFSPATIGQILVYVFVPLLALVASLSRSLWLGVAAAWLLSLFILTGHRKLTFAFKYILVTLVLLASAAGLVMAISRINWPVSALGSGSAQAFSDRFGSEPAGQARMNLLPHLFDAIKRQPIWGGGFGARVIYFSTDPRAVQSTAGGSGLTSTYALEWGWFDFMYKFGLIGFILLVFWLLAPFWRVVKLKRLLLLTPTTGAVALALIALYVTHLTTPYLNHPLGLGAVIVLGGFIFKQAETN